MSDSQTEKTDNTYSFVKKVVIFVLIALTTILFVLFIGRAIDIIMLIIAGIFLGIIFRSSRDLIHQTTRLNNGLSLAIVIIIFLGLFSGSIAFLGPRIAQQADKFYRELPETWNTVKDNISGFGWGRELARENPNFRDFFEDEASGTGEDHDMTKTILSYLSTSATAAAGFILIFVIAVHIAAEPQLYSEGFVRLFPYKRRKQIVQIMDEISITVQWWLVGQAFSMLILGILTTAGLWLLGVPYSLVLGLLTAMMTFIPNLGPIIAGVPTIIIALTVGVDTAIYTAIFIFVLQCIEGYFLTPKIHQRAISVPPVLIITVQFLLYYMVGFIGVLLAMPLMGCVMVLVKRLYLQDILGDPLEESTSYDLEGKNIF